MDSQHTLSRELALRIGLAARALPDTDAKSLFSVLTTAVGLPLTEDKLSKLDLPTLKIACDTQQADWDEALLARALFILKHATEQTGINKLAPQPYAEGDMPGSLRIACASNNGVQVDGHFGSCAQFMVYQVSATDARLIAVRDAELADGLVVPDKNSYRAERIQDCQVVYIASVGGPAAAKIVKLGIHPIKLTEVPMISEVIQQLQTVIAGTPPPWLAKAMGIDAPQRFRFDPEREQEATG
jgi:nitrogen fixation protein NifX